MMKCALGIELETELDKYFEILRERKLEGVILSLKDELLLHEL